jgi:acyl-CoA synthetase (AMP-forming)/AMP-acid ligase II
MIPGLKRSEALEMQMPRYTLADYENEYADRHLLHGVVAKWAKTKSDTVAIISADGSRTLTWKEFDRHNSAIAAELLKLGLRQGDFVVTQLPLTVDHVLLEYACFKVGVILAPIDLRLAPAEVVRVLEILRPRVFVSLGIYGPIDFRPVWSVVQEKCGWIEHAFAVSSEPIAGTRALAEITTSARKAAESENGFEEIDSAASQISPDHGALVIFTTGSTGSPKPALLSHRNITIQNMCMSGALFGGDIGLRALVHLPPSHVGCQTEMMMSTLFGGGSVVLLEIFDPAKTMRAIQQHHVEMFAQIPAMFNLVWMLKDYDQYDLSSLKLVAFGGNAVSKAFVDRVAGMAPLIATGLGLTECAGFCSYALVKPGEHEALATGLGVDMPVYPCTIRQPMRNDGTSGDELPDGEIGHVCFRGPQTFLGYVNDPDATANTISRDGYLYTGDLGVKDAMGLRLTGRAKWVIKSFGHQIYPGDVEAHISLLSDKVAQCVIVGAPHEVVGEGVVALVEKKPGAELEDKELTQHARTLPPYMRPRHWIVLEAGKMPLNRLAKPDYLRAQQMALEEITALRGRGEWDSRHVKA